ncbi:NAD(P)/FAD-dependent oxidoreductase [Mycolicibacterium sp. 050232]|uniref:flavin monoamine oxidase family protein n=1 Tax=Mycolicibacterium sp. 050232 TaxID=3113982 RepID=UPI002E2D2E86|nr:NAD(P)/FAD-dependent oxidoreductase [Mycolicibacterium sp. 050232]MED5812451.1 NAD(P)/FAD-dependent oxidoreductase [Mycolicibacterium sp. 050232]
MTAQSDATEQATVVVVGAGVSGLTAARELHRRGIDVVVLEAADRLGGRTMSETTALGSTVDLGGQWIGHGHRRLTALADELGLTRYQMHTGPMPGLIHRSRPLSAVSPAVLMAGAVLAGLEMLSRTGVPQRWNDITVESWLHRVPGRTPRRLLEVIAAVSWTADLDRHSVYAAARMIRQQGGVLTMLSTKGGAQDSLLVEGMRGLAAGLAADLDSRIRLGHRVVSIRRDDCGVTVQTTAGAVRASKVIVTVPAPVAASINYDPPLPPDRAQLADHTYMGSVYKAIAVYDDPFWRRRRGGELIVLDGPGSGVFDTSPPDGPGHLCVLIGGPAARELDGLSADARQKAVLEPLIGHIGPEVLDPVSWHEKSWHTDEYAGGGYMALPIAGTLGGLLPWPCEPVGHIHWAGTETASDHAGYIEGAIESGLRVAHEVTQALAATAG